MELIDRNSILITPDPKRVICQFMTQSTEKKTRNIIQRILSLSDEQSLSLLDSIYQEFETRHRNINEIFLYNFSKIAAKISDIKSLTKDKKLLLGAYFTNEYSIESAAIMNPSMIIHPEEKNLQGEQCRYIISLRSVGEGHISSIQFRTGLIKNNSSVELDPVTKFVQMGLLNTEVVDKNGYTEVSFEGVNPISERILFPLTADEQNGMEDARFVRFEDGTYYATYTAYDGHQISIKMIETSDFITFRFYKLSGKAVRNKGMALFPRKINDQYVMISREDNENLFITYSDQLLKWDEAKLLDQPEEPWEYVQMGNCGSPIEINEGWILLTHGVGPMRKYVISAILLDKENPSKIVAKLRQPLISPNTTEREGYVPNVVYSCGGIVYRDRLFIPYAMSDYASGIASITVNKLLSNMIDF